MTRGEAQDVLLSIKRNYGKFSKEYWALAIGFNAISDLREVEKERDEYKDRLEDIEYRMSDDLK